MKFFLAKCEKRLVKGTPNAAKALRFKSKDDAVFFAELVKLSGIKLDAGSLHIVSESSLDKGDGEVAGDAFFVGFVIDPKTLNKPNDAIGIGQGVTDFECWWDVAKVHRMLRYAIKYCEKEMVAEEVAA